jgi:hypothetical protein
MKRAEALVLAGGLALYAGLAVSSLRRQSATYDEGAHLPAGYSYLLTGDHRLNPEHPPLAKLIAAAPLCLLPGVVFKTDDLAWTTGRQWELGRRFLYAWNDADRLLFFGRLPIVALGAALCALVALEARRRFGSVAGFIALGLAVLSPDVLAHGQLVTTDLAVTLFLFAAVVAWEAYLRRPGGPRLVLAGLLVAAAVATKFSALVLFPVLALLAVASEVPGRARRAVSGLAVVSLMAFMGLWAAYGFASRLTEDAHLRDELRATTLHDEGETVVARGLLGVERLGLLPEAYTRGFLFAYRHAERRPTFLNGRVSEDGFPLFFPISFAIKTPIPLILLVVAAAVWGSGTARERLGLWLPVVLYLLLTQTRGLNIGHRHLLPIYPFLFVLAAGVAARSWVSRPRTRVAARGALVFLFAWYAVGTLRVHPHHLAYFNEVAGGPGGGYHWLVDSSLDWGQDLKGLRPALDALGIPKVKLSYFGSADPSYYGIDAELLPSTMSPRPAHVIRDVRPGDVLAVSATNLQGVYLDDEDRRLMERVRALPPLGDVGHSLFLFRSDFTWPPPDARPPDP